MSSTSNPLWNFTASLQGELDLLLVAGEEWSGSYPGHFTPYRRTPDRHEAAGTMEKSKKSIPLSCIANCSLCAGVSWFEQLFGTDRSMVCYEGYDHLCFWCRNNDDIGNL
jgi:hypothetical protein